MRPRPDGACAVRRQAACGLARVGTCAHPNSIPSQGDQWRPSGPNCDRARPSSGHVHHASSSISCARAGCVARAWRTRLTPRARRLGEELLLQVVGQADSQLGEGEVIAPLPIGTDPCAGRRGRPSDSTCVVRLAEDQHRAGPSLLAYGASPQDHRRIPSDLNRDGVGALQVSEHEIQQLAQLRRRWLVMGIGLPRGHRHSLCAWCTGARH
jgi:hypothetical protein